MCTSFHFEILQLLTQTLPCILLSLVLTILSLIRNKHLAPVVQRVGNLVGMLLSSRVQFIHLIVIYSVDRVIHSLLSQGLVML